MLNKEELLGLGYEINPDPDQQGKFYWKNDSEGSDISFDTEAEAIQDASEDAHLMHTLYRCANCGKVHNEQTLVLEIKDLTERILPGVVMPEGECPDCGAFCYPIEKDPDWGMVMAYFGLDTSFCWTEEHIRDYTKQFLDATGSKDMVGSHQAGQTEPDWKAIATNLAGALDACVTQIEQMKGMFDDSDGAIQRALDDAETAGTEYSAATS